MNKRTLASCLRVAVLSALPSVVSAQAYDGLGLSGAAEGEVDRAAPASLLEARQQGRGYTLGQGRRAATQVTDEKSPSHVVGEGETLSTISELYFGDSMQWPRLWSYNPHITNPHWIYPGTVVHLAPPDEGAPTTVTEGQVGEGDVRVAPGATKVTVVSDTALTPGAILLREQGYLDRDALQRVGQIMGAPEEAMILSLGDQAYVTFSGEGAVQAGDEFTVFRKLDDWERFPTERGELVKILGTLTVRSFDPDTRLARTLVTESLDVIERGFYVAKLDRQFQVVKPKENGHDVQARVIASTRPRGLLSYGDVVFLDVGETSGVEAGNRFFVVRQGDPFLEGIRGRESEVGAMVKPPEYHPEAMPKEVVAELRVVKVRKDTTIAFVTRSDTDLTYGDLAEMRKGY